MASASGHRGAAVLVVLLVAMAGTASLVHATCPTDPTQLEVCEGAVTSGGGNPNSYAGCCPAVNGWGLDCLCALVTEYSSTIQSSNIDINKCLAMPAECGVYVPPNTVCDGYSVTPSP